MTTQLVEMFLLRLADFGGAGCQNLVSRRYILWVSKWYPLLALGTTRKSDDLNHPPLEASLLANIAFVPCPGAWSKSFVKFPRGAWGCCTTAA